MEWRNGYGWREPTSRSVCHFGITEIGIPALIASFAGEAAAGIGAAEGIGAGFGGEALFGGAEAAGLFGGEAAGGLFGGGEALGLGGADAFAAGTAGDLLGAGGFGDAFGAGGFGGDLGGGFGSAGAATGDLAGIPNALAAPPGGASGLGASGFAPAPGVELAGGIAPDATSAAAFNPGVDTFATRADAVSGAIQGGAFDPQGANSTLFSGAGSPAGSPPPGASSGLPVQSVPTESFTQVPGAASGGAQGGTAGLDQSILGAQAQPPAPTSLQPPGATVPGGAPAATPAGSPGFMEQVGNSVMKNPVGLGLGAAGLGYSVLQGQKQTAATKALADQAAKQSATGDQLSSYLTSGTLPPGLQASVDQATQSAKATAIANAAQQGLPTDPTQNTALAQRLAQIDQQGPIVAAQIATGLLQSGASFAGLSNQLYTQLAQIDQQQSQSIGKAIASMASALNTGGTRIQIGGSAA